MSIEHNVYLVSVPSTLEDLWLAKLSECGYVCELHPSIRLLAKETDGVWLKLIGFPSSKRQRPEAALLLGFGFQADPRSLIEEKGWPVDAAASLKGIPWTSRVWFRTAMGASNMSRHLQLLGAACLACVTNGYLESDEGELIHGDEAVKYALEQISMTGSLNDVGEYPFEKWPPLDPEAEASFTYPAPIAAPKRPWWKLWV